MGSVGATSQRCFQVKRGQTLSPKGMKAPEPSEGISGRAGTGALRKPMGDISPDSICAGSEPPASPGRASSTFPEPQHRRSGLPGVRTPELELSDVLLHMRVVRSHSASE